MSDKRTLGNGFTGSSLSTSFVESSIINHGADGVVLLELTFIGDVGDSDEYQVFQFPSIDGQHFDTNGVWLATGNLDSDSAVVKLLSTYPCHSSVFKVRMKSTSSETPDFMGFYTRYNLLGEIEWT